MENEETQIEPQPNTTEVEDTHQTGDSIEETPVQEFPDMMENGLKPEEGKKEDKKVIISVEECENFYGCILEAGHGIIAGGKGKPHRDLPLERRKAQGKVLHRLIEKYNIQIPAEFDIIIMGASVVADWQYMGAVGQNEEIEPEPEAISKSVEINPDLGGVITNDAKAVEENNKIEVTE